MSIKFIAYCLSMGIWWVVQGRSRQGKAEPSMDLNNITFFIRQTGMKVIFKCFVFPMT